MTTIETINNLAQNTYEGVKRFFKNSFNIARAMVLSGVLASSIAFPGKASAESTAIVSSSYTLDGVTTWISCALRESDYACGIAAYGWPLTTPTFRAVVNGREIPISVVDYKGDVKRGYAPASSAQIIVPDSPTDSNTVTVTATNKDTGTTTLAYVYL